MKKMCIFAKYFNDCDNSVSGLHRKCVILNNGEIDISMSRIANWFTSHQGCRSFIVLYVCVFMLFLYLSHEIMHAVGLVAVVAALADTSLFTLPFVFLRGHWRWLGAAFVLLAGGIVLANVLYYRNFGDMIPGSLYLNNQAMDSLVLRSAVNSLKLSDIIIAVFSMAPCIWLVFDRKCKLGNSDRLVMFMIVGCVLVLSWIAVVWGMVRRWRVWYPDSEEHVMEILYPNDSCDWVVFYTRTNFTGYMVRALNKSVNTYHELSQVELERIKRHLSSKKQDYLVSADVDRPVNLIFIVVESFPSAALQRKDSEVVVPVLTNLLKDSLTLYVDRCKVLAGLGHSSDGQFIYNTGLLPLRNDILVTNYAINDYPSLAKALNKESLEIIGEDKSLWSHGMTNKSYGYSRILDNVAPWGSPKELDQDSLILVTAADEISRLKDPYFVFITTLSMHDPYDTPNVTHKLDKLELENSTHEYREYMERLHHFDEALGRFLDSLKEMHLYDRTCIVILGDHQILQTSGIQCLRDDAVPLIILNSPLHGIHTKECTQIDVFPTILDIMGVNYEFMGVRYTGLGTSIFRHSPDAGPQLPDDLDYEVSELIIRRR